jgi:hypothetical protein
MCATQSPRTRVRWASLYAVVLFAFAATATIGIVPLPVRWRVDATVVVFVAGAIGMLRCLAMQRVALDLSDWCDCAKSTVTVRIVETREKTCSGSEDEQAAERPHASAASLRAAS